MKKKSKKSSNPLHLIVDSADGLGKTTVCDLLSLELDIPVIKMADMPDYFKKNPEAASKIYNKTVVQFKEFSFIQDRGWPTSLVYSKVYKRKVKDLDYLAEVIGKLNEKVFLLYGSKPFRSDKLVDRKKWNKLNKEYMDVIDPEDLKFLERVGVEIHRISIDGKTARTVCNEILKHI
jgi:hypothetical protein